MRDDGPKHKLWAIFLLVFHLNFSQKFKFMSICAALPCFSWKALLVSAFGFSLFKFFIQFDECVLCVGFRRSLENSFVRCRHRSAAVCRRCQRRSSSVHRSHMSVLASSATSCLEFRYKNIKILKNKNKHRNFNIFNVKIIGENARFAAAALWHVLLKLI